VKGLLQLKSWIDLPQLGERAMIHSFLGGGAQGEVYLIKTEKGDSLALKWYHKAQSTKGQCEILLNLIRQGAPSKHFLWPIEVLTLDQAVGFGYTMPLRSPKKVGLNDLMNDKVSPSFQILLETCIHFTQAFKQLHSRGFCYSDINFGNLFFDPETGEVEVCDNDNIVINGHESMGVLGTLRFMAPEIVRGESKPNTETDLFSLSVLLFYMLFIHHPLEGRREQSIRCLDLPAMRQLYGTQALFIFDPEDKSNRPVAGLQNNPLLYWDIYPDFMKVIFIKAFTAGMNHPQRRVRESEWTSTLQQLQDQLQWCRCGAENFFDPEAKAEGACWSCKKSLPVPIRMELGRCHLVLNHNSCLWPRHLHPSGKNPSHSGGKAMARVVQHPSIAHLWGLQNETTSTWSAQLPNGQEQKVLPGQKITVAQNTTIRFGSIEGHIL
jgi:DNA-binding helix-hairpin-helix protein with protein kinase domain